MSTAIALAETFDESGVELSSEEPLKVNEHSAQSILTQMERILRSSSFVRSKRLGKFLRFTVQQYLDGKQGTLKEYLVGVEVFGKHETFDPRIDSIVRVEARRLRSKLDRYYTTEGKHDPLVIQFRKGSYVPTILTRDEVQSMSAEPPSRSAGVKTIGVATFSNFGVEATHAFFCAGLTEDIISSLTKVPTLRVVAHIQQSPEKPEPDFLLEGSVRKQLDRFRIAAQLIDTAEKVYVWSETYERDITDAFSVQDEISRAIVQSLQNHLQPSI